ncbi:MAG: Na/Pi symporter [Victivallales bacterium]|nr:Na/Pi symporter [Victivallales bacterium]
MMMRLFPKSRYLFILVSFLLIAGCKKKELPPPDLLQVFSGDSQTCEAGGYCKDMTVVEVMSAPAERNLGRSPKRHSLQGIKLKVTPLTPGASAEPSEGISDAGGDFRIRLKSAPFFGDQYFRVECIDNPDVKPLLLHLLSGVKVSGDMQEVSAGKSPKEPITITLTDGQGKPAPNVPVFFSLKSGDSDAKITAEHSTTDEKGRISFSISTPSGVTGKYEVLAEIGTGDNRTRGLVLTVMAVSWLNISIAVLGGLAIFIFGMTMMSDGLQQIAGNKLKGLLQMFTSNNFNAMLAGLIVTALIQSSGATTVMVVGFINASLLNLTQGIGVILGSSIGTTITAQMVSFNLDSLSMPAIFVGVALLLFTKNDRIRGLANTVLGFGLLFFGMVMMSGQLRAIADFPTFVSAFQTFDCTPSAGSAAPPILAVLGAIVVGIIMTIIVQSSSATVGLAIAMADSGLLNYYTAVPLILGDNIGSTITGLLATVNVSRASRQAAMSSLIQKTLCVLLMIPFLYIPWDGVPCFMRLVDVITSGDVFAPIPENLGRHLASLHTLFNVISVALFLPCIPLLEWLSKLLVPDREDDDGGVKTLCKLERRLLNTPSAALTHVFSALTKMIEGAMRQTKTCLNATINEEKPTANDVNDLEARIDATQHSIIDYLVSLTKKHLTDDQASAIPVFMHCVNDVERIGDRALNIFQLLPKDDDRGMSFSEEAVNELRLIRDELDTMQMELLNGLRHNDMDSIRRAMEMSDTVKKMTARCEDSHEDRLLMQACTVERGVAFVEILSNLERVAAHLKNVAERAEKMLPHSVSLPRQNRQR